MQAPSWFLRELREFDSDLRCRWSARLEMFQLERRVCRSLHPGTIRNDNYHDDCIRAQDGFILVATIPPHAFSRSIFEKLRASDLWAGGWEAMARQIEEHEEAIEQKRDQDFADDIRSMSRELYEILKIRDGRTVFNALG